MEPTQNYITPAFFKTSQPATTTANKYDKGSIAEGLSSYLISKRNADYVRSTDKLEALMD